MPTVRVNGVELSYQETGSGTPLRDWTELGSMEAIKELVKLGLGVSFTAKWIALKEISDRSLVWLPLRGAKLKRTWCIAAASGRQLNIAEHTFIGLCQTVARELISAPHRRSVGGTRPRAAATPGQSPAR